MSIGARIRIHGLVQGVGFRFFVFRLANRLDLKGLVRNNYDGSVDIEVEGDRSQVEELLKEVKVGPRAAHVTNVIVEWTEFENKFRGFEVH